MGTPAIEDMLRDAWTLCMERSEGTYCRNKGNHPKILLAAKISVVQLFHPERPDALTGDDFKILWHLDVAFGKYTGNEVYEEV